MRAILSPYPHPTLRPSICCCFFSDECPSTTRSPSRSINVKLASLPGDQAMSRAAAAAVGAEYPQAMGGGGAPLSSPPGSLFARTRLPVVRSLQNINGIWAEESSYQAAQRRYAQIIRTKRDLAASYRSLNNTLATSTCVDRKGMPSRSISLPQPFEVLVRCGICFSSTMTRMLECLSQTQPPPRAMLTVARCSLR